MHKYLFIDRDGTLIYEPADGKIDSLNKLQILPYVVESLKKLQKRFNLVMISNQPGLGSLDFPQSSFDVPQNELMRTLKENGINFNEVYFCPHTKEEKCTCRKPQTGFLDSLIKEGDVDIKNSYVIGDRETDLQLAQNIGCEGIFYSVDKQLQTEFTSLDWREITSHILSKESDQ